MSRLNRRTTKVIEEPEPVAVTRAKRFFPRQKPAPAPPQAGAPAGIFYEQEVRYRIPRDVFIPSAINKAQYEDGKVAATTMDTAIRVAQKDITNAVEKMRVAAYEIKKLSDTESDHYKGFVDSLSDTKNDISYKIWTKLLLGQGGILEQLQSSNDVLKDINAFMATRPGMGNEWNVQVARFIEVEEDGAANTVEKLKHLKKAQANAMLLRQAEAELALRIKESTDAEKEGEAAQNLRMQELENLVKKQEEQLHALLDRHRQSLHEATAEENAKSEEIADAALNATNLLKKGVREARKQVALDVTEYADTIVKETEEQELEPQE